MTNDQLTAILAQRIMGWRVAPDRFLLGNRQWITRARFQPMSRIQDAFRLLQRSASNLSLRMAADGTFTAVVRIGNRTGSASGHADASTITLAIARAVGIEVGDLQ